MNIRFQTVWPCFTPATHRYYDGSDSCLPSPRLTGLPACLATPTQHCASNHVMYPSIALHAITQRTGRVPGFALREQARRHIPPKRVRHPAHCQFALQLLSTPPHSDAVTFGYRVLACPDTDLHRADVAPSRAHSPALAGSSFMPLRRAPHRPDPTGVVGMLCTRHARRRGRWLGVAAR